MTEIAVFGGTFDPPTKAHEAIIEACLADQSFDQVWVMPSGDRIDKPLMLPETTRFEMLKELHAEHFTNTAKLEVTDFELQLPRPTQTYSTVKALEEQYPDNKFWFVYGADSYYDMPRWQDGRRLQATLGILLVPRAGYEIPQGLANVRSLRLTEDLAYTSSTEVRGRIEQGESVDHLVSNGVARFILEKGLYQAVQ